MHVYFVLPTLMGICTKKIITSTMAKQACRLVHLDSRRLGSVNSRPLVHLDRRLLGLFDSRRHLVHCLLVFCGCGSKQMGLAGTDNGLSGKLLSLWLAFPCHG